LPAQYAGLRAQSHVVDVAPVPRLRGRILLLTKRTKDFQKTRDCQANRGFLFLFETIGRQKRSNRKNRNRTKQTNDETEQKRRKKETG